MKQLVERKSQIDLFVAFALVVDSEVTFVAVVAAAVVAAVAVVG